MTRKQKRKKNFWQRFWQNVQKVWQILKKIWAIIVAIVSGLIFIVGAFNQLAPDFKILLEKSSPLPSDLVVYVSSDQFSAKSYLDILAVNGFKTKYIDASQIGDLPSLKPGIVIIGSVIGLTEIDQNIKNYLAKNNIKIIGMGETGAEFFGSLTPYSAVSIGNVAHFEHGSYNFVSINQNAPKNIIADLPLKKPIRLYSVTNIPVWDVAVYDQGSLEILGAKGIALWNRTCKGGYWPIVIQGNHALWGYGIDGQSLTDEGKTLFVNIVKYMQGTSYDIPELEHLYYKQGTYGGTLGCKYIENVYPFKVNDVGDINLNVKSSREVSLILNGPGQVGYYARVDNISPKLTYHITKEDLNRGNEWSASVSYFGPIENETRIGYSLDISYPFNETNILFWTIYGLCLSLFIFLVFLHRRSVMYMFPSPLTRITAIIIAIIAIGTTIISAIGLFLVLNTSGIIQGFDEQASYTGDCNSRPVGSVCILYEDHYIWLIHDSITRWDYGGTWQGKKIQVAKGVNADYQHVLGTLLIKQISR